MIYLTVYRSAFLECYADDTHITYAGSDLHLIQYSLSHDLEKAKQMACK